MFFPEKRIIRDVENHHMITRAVCAVSFSGIFFMLSSSVRFGERKRWKFKKKDLCSLCLRSRGTSKIWARLLQTLTSKGYTSNF